MRRPRRSVWRSEEHTSELQSLAYLVCRLLLEKKKIMISSVGVAVALSGGIFVLGLLLVVQRSRSAVFHVVLFFSFFFNDTATTEIYTLSLHDALPTSTFSMTPCLARSAPAISACISRPPIRNGG